MVATYILIQLLEKEKIKYTTPLGEWIKSRFPGITTFDFDNYSKKFLVDRAIELVMSPGKLILEINAEEISDTGQVTHFLNRLLRDKNDNKMIIFSGNHIVIQKMIGILDDRQVIKNTDLSRQQESVNKFLID